MIILRRLTKLFARRDVFPNELKKIYYPILNNIENINDVEFNIKVEKSNQFNQQYKKNFSNQTRIDNFIKELKSNPLSRFEDAGDNFADTHYLEDYSSKSDGYVMFSKKINNADRFNYRIYKPIIMIDKETGKSVINQKIVLDSCSGHIISGKPGNYSPGKEREENTWHSPNKSAKLKRKLKKQNKKDDLK